MSIKLIDKVTESGLPSAQRFVLLILCDAANDDGACYPSQETIARKTGFAIRSVKRHILWLEYHGLISRERRQKSNVRKSDLYHVNIDLLNRLVSGETVLEGAKLAHSDSEGANLARARLAPPKVPNLQGEGANLAPSLYEEPSIEPSIEPSVCCDGANAADAMQIVLLENENPIQPAKPKSKTANPDNLATWEAYRQAYLHRYGVEPIRNAQANALIANLVKSVGGNEAPKLAWFYVGHNKGWYVQNRHALKHLIADVQAIRTDWMRGEQMTAVKARQTERQTGTAQAAAALIAKYQNEG